MKSYSRFLSGIAELATGTGFTLIAPHLTCKAEGILVRERAERDTRDKFEAEIKAALELGETKGEEEGVGPKLKSSTIDVSPPSPSPLPITTILPPTSNITVELPSAAPPPPVQIFTSLNTSLRSLVSGFPAPPPPPTSTPATGAPIALAARSLTPQQDALAKSLGSLTEYLEKETFASASAAYRAYGSSFGLTPGGSTSTTTTGPGKDQKSLFEAVSNFKTEIRSVKGEY